MSGFVARKYDKIDDIKIILNELEMPTLEKPFLFNGRQRRQIIIQRICQDIRKVQPCAHQECQNVMLTHSRTVHQDPARKNEGEMRLEENRLQEQLIGDPEDDNVNIVQS